MLKKILGIIALIFPPLLLVSCSSPNRDVYIARVHDGDTFYDSGNTKFRLFGVDTAELTGGGKDGFAVKDGIELAYGTSATVITKDMIEKKTVHITHVTFDPYNREVVKVSINGKDLASELIKAGEARVAYFETNPSSPFYSSDFKYLRHLLDLQFKAFEKSIKFPNSGNGFWDRPDEFKKIFPKA